MISFSLEGKTALVTGANRGIGKAIAQALDGAGAHVICAGVSSPDATVAELQSAEGIQVDLSDPDALTHVFDERPIDILVNNAGIIRRDDTIDFSEYQSQVGVSEFAGLCPSRFEQWAQRQDYQHGVAAVFSGRHPCPIIYCLQTWRRRIDQTNGE